MKHLIKDIKQTKKGIKIIFEDDISFLLSINDFADGYYYPNKSLSDEEYKDLKDKSNYKKIAEYLNRVLSSKRYTYKEIETKLSSKYHLSSSKIQSILSPYVDNKIIDDYDFALEFIETKVLLGYGKEYILHSLKQKGINEEILKRNEVIESLNTIDYEILRLLISKMDKSKRNIPLLKRKNQIMMSLIKRGYQSQLCRKEIDDFYSSRNEEEKKIDQTNQYVTLKKEAERCYNSLSRKKYDSYKKKESFIQKLISKGYAYSEIEPILKEYSFND